MLGIDLVDISRIHMMWMTGRRQVLMAMLSDFEGAELANITHNDLAIRYIAKRIAVKEAFFKATGNGIRTTYEWKSVWIEHDEKGAPILKNNQGINAHVSLSDTDTTAGAVVLLIK